MQKNVEVLARRVEADIKRRGLASGDRYLTGDEVGRLLNVSSVSANRAMQLLAERGLLVRQRKIGTFVGEGVELPPNSTRKRVHLILTSGIWPNDHLIATSYVNQLLCGVMEAMPGVSIQTDIVGPQEINGFVRRIIGKAASSSEVAGVVLVRSSPDTQRVLAEAGVPTVVFGSVFMGVGKLACVTIDQAQVGQLTADYLIKAKHPRAMTLMVNPWLPGDNAFISAMMELWQGADRNFQLEIQSVPADDAVCYEVVESILSRELRPTAIVARSAWVACKVHEAARALGLRIPDDLELILGNHHEVEIDGRRLPGAQAVKSMLECGRSLGRKLIELNQHRPAEAGQELVPVEFVEM